jgi:hypothetical protein
MFPVAQTGPVRNKVPTTRVTIAAAVASFLGALYLRLGDELFLAGAATALALIAYWIAEDRRGGAR